MVYFTLNVVRSKQREFTLRFCENGESWQDLVTYTLLWARPLVDYDVYLKRIALKATCLLGIRMKRSKRERERVDKTVDRGNKTKRTERWRRQEHFDVLLKKKCSVERWKDVSAFLYLVENARFGQTKSDSSFLLSFIQLSTRLLLVATLCHFALLQKWVLTA